MVSCARFITKFTHYCRVCNKIRALLAYISRRAVQSYRPHLEERDPIWGDDWSHSPFIRRSPSWGFPGFSSAVRQIPGDLCTVPGTISLSPLSLATDVTDVTLEAIFLWLGTRIGAGGTATLAKSFLFLPQPMAPWTTDIFRCISCLFLMSSSGRSLCRSLQRFPSLRSFVLP